MIRNFSFGIQTAPSVILPRLAFFFKELHNPKVAKAAVCQFLGEKIHSEALFSNQIIHLF